jgi:cullin 4
MLTALGMYSESFEKPFLECTSEFYATEGVRYMQQSDIPDYLKHVEVRIYFLMFFMLSTHVEPVRHTI